MTKPQTQTFYISTSIMLSMTIITRLKRAVGYKYCPSCGELVSDLFWGNDNPDVHTREVCVKCDDKRRRK
jgi:Zn ribbon nucleic-acid-binding protein